MYKFRDDYKGNRGGWTQSDIDRRGPSRLDIFEKINNNNVQKRAVAGKRPGDNSENQPAQQRPRTSQDISDDSSPDNTQGSSHSGTQREAQNIFNSQNEPLTRPVSDIVPEVVEADSGGDIEMSLPGTARGQGGSGEGNANASMEVYSPEKPFSNFGHKISTYKKVHRFLTAANANNIIVVNVGASAGGKVITTGLGTLHWDRPFFYLNPSEFALLPRGSHVKEVRLKVVHRGTRIAFEVGSSASGLATLNQITDVICGLGLNKTGWGIDAQYSYSTAPMVPTEVNIVNTYAPIINEYYGTAQNNALFVGGAIPRHQLGQWMPLSDYFTLTLGTNGTDPNERLTGVPTFQKYIKYYDGKTTIDQVVLSAKYKPVMGMLKDPLPHFRIGMPQSGATNYDVMVNQNLIATNKVTVGRSTGGIVTFNETESDTDTSPNAVIFDYQGLIEKSQISKNGPWGQMQKATIQPSAHIGINAIPSLTTNTSSLNSYTDGQGYFEVYAEMDVIEHLPTEFPIIQIANVPAGDQITFPTDETIPTPFGCTYAGLYPNQTAGFVPVPP